MNASPISTNQPLNAASLNTLSYTPQTTPSTKSKNSQSNFRTKTQEPSVKPSKLEPVVLIRMEQLAPEGAVITHNDGKHSNNASIICVCNIF